MESTLVPIFICVVLPVAIVLIVFLAAMNSDNKRAAVLIKAIEANQATDTDKLIDSLKKPRKTVRELLNLRLLRGCIFSLVGLILVIIGLINKISGCEFSNDPVTIPFIFGGISLPIGVSYLIVYFVSRKQVNEPEDR